jgi:hypothetical protein
LSWLDDTLSSITGDPSTSTGVYDDGSIVGGSINDVTNTLASITQSVGGQQFAAAADRLLGNNNVVDQVYGGVAAAAAAGAPPVVAPSPAKSLLVNYAPLIIAALVALAFVFAGKK